MKNIFFVYAIISLFSCEANILAMQADLIEAALTNDVEAIRSYTGNVNQEVAIDGARFNALHVAIACRSKAVVEELLRKGASPDKKYESTYIGFVGDKPEGCGSVEQCSGVLLGRNFWKSPLHLAVNVKDFGIISLLLENKADPNVIDNNGCTPLFFAAHAGLTAIVCALIRAGAHSEIMYDIPVEVCRAMKEAFADMMRAKKLESTSH